MDGERLGGFRGVRYHAKPAHAVFNPLELLTRRDHQPARDLGRECGDHRSALRAGLTHENGHGNLTVRELTPRQGDYVTKV